MKTGIIMEMNERFLTLLTPEGEFLRAHNHHNHYQLGQEIEFFPVEIDEMKKSILPPFFQSFKGKAIFSVALILMLTFASLIPLLGSNEVYAYMSIDVNPSIELGINDNFQVIEFVSYNHAGKKIIDKIHNWKKKNIHVLANEILQEMKVQGYIKPNREIVIATVYKENQLEKSKRWEAEMNEIKNTINKENLELKVVEGSNEDRAQAKEEGLTTGQFKTKQLNTKPAATQHSEEKPLKYDSKRRENPNDKNLTQNQSKKQPDQQAEQQTKVQLPEKQHENDKTNGPSYRKDPEFNNRTQIPPGHEKIMERKQNQSKEEKRREYKDKRIPPGQNKKQEKKHDYRDENNDRKLHSNKKENQHHKNQKDD
ncbi:anti-sigma factor domain-containing protein [Cytobacillus solani]|uniref:anti-sigma factor domain-containing protein n=1 Tax=Cytobacillus solani TaxID=1637975 RepID=UPI0006F27C7D|nr:anti-sigma factor domain-containing protein [Cytobacillus solani]